MTPHDLRHTHVALLITQGEHAKAIQMRLGHSSISTTLNVYGHLMPGIDEAAAAGLDEAATRYTRATDADIVDIWERNTP